jgi:hypothetical protein
LKKCNPPGEELRSFCRDNDVIAFAFAKQKMFAEEQIFGADGALEVIFPYVVQVDTPAFDILASRPRPFLPIRQ